VGKGGTPVEGRRCAPGNAEEVANMESSCLGGGGRREQGVGVGGDECRR
jgi:hypothetical protein